MTDDNRLTALWLGQYADNSEAMKALPELRELLPAKVRGSVLRVLRETWFISEASVRDLTGSGGLRMVVLCKVASAVIQSALRARGYRSEPHEEAECCPA